MAKFVMMSMVFTVVLLMSAAIALPNFHPVGDSMGWAIPKEGEPKEFFNTWATKRQFVVGDELTFNFGPNSHNIQEVVKNAYDTCDIAGKEDAIGDLITELANVTLNSTGEHYYICTKEGHCQKGMKLSIFVSPTSPTVSVGVLVPMMAVVMGFFF